MIYPRILCALFVSFAFSAGAAEPAAETYTLDPMHTSVGWSINHFGFSNPSGKFVQVQGILTLDFAAPDKSKVSATIKIADLVTGLAKLDEHLKSKDFFDAEHFPMATFVSDKVEPTGKDTAKVTGTLTLHGVAKPVTLDVKLNKAGPHPIVKKKTAGFTITTELKRSDFGISAYLPGLGNEVKIAIESEANIADSGKP